MRSASGRLRVMLAIGAVGASCFAATPAQAATDIYPAGGGSFSGGPQGWQVTAASCNVALLCTASGGYDPGDGNPPGSIAADTTIALNLLSLFKSTVTVQSPDFKVQQGGDATLHLDRQFAAGALIDLAPQLSYTVTLIDRTANSNAEPLTETLGNTPAFVGKDAAVTVKQGHTYAISITAETSSTVVGTGLLAGTISARFDNVAVTVQTSGGGGGGAGGGTTNASLASLAQNSLVGPAVLSGNRILVKVRCPKKASGPWRVALRGLLTRRKPATSTRRARVRPGKVKRVALRVRPRAKAKLATRKRLLFKETVRSGSAKATVYKRLKLIRR